jgi:hypothetical protein
MNPPALRRYLTGISSIRNTRKLQAHLATAKIVLRLLPVIAQPSINTSRTLGMRRAIPEAELAAMQRRVWLSRIPRVKR